MASSKNYRQRFDFAVNNSTTLWELKKLIANECLMTSKDGGTTYRIYPDEQGKMPP
jgi:hypothetical protein